MDGAALLRLIATRANCGIKLVGRHPTKGGAAFLGLQQLPARQVQAADGGGFALKNCYDFNSCLSISLGGYMEI